MLMYDSMNPEDGHIPPGFMLTIDTWENDGDNCKSTTLYGLKKGDVKFYISLLNALSGGGNEEVSKQFENVALVTALAESPPESLDLRNDLEGMVECQDCSDFVYDLIGIWNEGEMYRVFERAKVHYVPDICLDVTEGFNR